MSMKWRFFAPGNALFIAQIIDSGIDLVCKMGGFLVVLGHFFGRFLASISRVVFRRGARVFSTDARP